MLIVIRDTRETVTLHGSCIAGTSSSVKTRHQSRLETLPSGCLFPGSGEPRRLMGGEDAQGKCLSPRVGLVGTKAKTFCNSRELLLSTNGRAVKRLSRDFFCFGKTKKKKKLFLLGTFTCELSFLFGCCFESAEIRLI